MNNIKIINLPENTSPSLSGVTVVVDNENATQVSLSTIKDLILSGFTGGGGTNDYLEYTALISQENVYLTDGTLTIGDTYYIEDYLSSYMNYDDFSNVAQVVEGTINNTYCVFIATGTTPTNWSNNSVLLSVTESAPTAKVLKNTIGDITWSRYDYGRYRATLNGAFTIDKTFLNANMLKSVGYNGFLVESSPTLNFIEFTTYGIYGYLDDNVLSYIPIEIRVYSGTSSIPSVILDKVTNIGPGSADVTATVVSDGGQTILERGFVWGNYPNPTINGYNNQKTINTGTTTGTFTETITGPGYYSPLTVRPYVLNTVGVNYGPSFNIDIPCFTEGTLITMSDGSKKKIEEIDYSDSLLVWNFDDSKFDVASPLWIMKPVTTKYVNIEFSDGSSLGIAGTLETKSSHRIFNLDKGEFTYSIPEEHTPIGTRTFNDKGEIVTIVGKTESEGVANIYNVVTDYHMNIFAEGILTSRRLNNIYPISDMKFVKDNREIIPASEFKNIPLEYYNGLRLGEQPVISKSEGFLVNDFSKNGLCGTPTVEELNLWMIQFMEQKLELIYEDTIS